MTPQEETVILEARDILGRYLSQTLHDHVIVGAGTELSLRALGKL